MRLRRTGGAHSEPLPLRRGAQKNSTGGHRPQNRPSVKFGRLHNYGYPPGGTSIKSYTRTYSIPSSSFQTPRT